jgi:putative ABC transport system permease protein
MAENVILGLIGAALGAVIGTLIALGISAVGIPMPPMPNTEIGYTAYIRAVPSEIRLAAIIGFLATVLASIWPGRKASRIPVVEGLRQN